jgi:hypothetical protein
LLNGALFCTFNFGSADEAFCEFKQYDGVVRDSFTIQTRVPDTTPTTAIEIPVASAHEDAQWYAGSGGSCVSTSLNIADLARSSPSQVAALGLLFRNVLLDPNQLQNVISSAALDFYVSGTGWANLSVAVELTGNAEPICDSRGQILDISQRTWSTPVVWHLSTARTSGEWVSSPDLSELLRAVAASPAWASGNNILLHVTATAAEGTLVVDAFEADDKVGFVLNGCRRVEGFKYWIY